MGVKSPEFDAQPTMIARPPVLGFIERANNKTRDKIRGREDEI